MTKFTLISIFLTLSVSAYSASCKLPSNEYLTIGCSTTCQQSYRNAINIAAYSLGYKVKIISMYNKEHIINFNDIDAFIVPGGEDIDPKYYKGKVEQELKLKLDRLDYLVDYSEVGKIRDPFEYKLWQNYFSANNTQKLPALGICRGMQMMAVSQNIPLYIDINHEIDIPNRRNLSDNIQLTKDATRLKNILNFSNFWAHKNHHQGIRVDYFHQNKQRWPHLSISSYSNNGKIAESLESQIHLALGVQFHPEQDKGLERLKIFSWLLENGCHNKISKLNNQIL